MIIRRNSWYIHTKIFKNNDWEINSFIVSPFVDSPTYPFPGIAKGVLYYSVRLNTKEIPQQNFIVKNCLFVFLDFSINMFCAFDFLEWL